MAYTTVSNIQDKLGTTLTDDQSTFFTSVLSDAIDTYIDRMTETTFEASDPTDVYVSGDGTTILVIPTMNTITAVASVDDSDVATVLDTTSYVLYPRSDTNKYSIRRTDGSWSCGIENYKVTGVLGYAAVPSDITLVATELAVISLNQNDNNYKSEKVGDWAVTYSNLEQTLSSNSTDILNSYARLSRKI